MTKDALKEWTANKKRTTSLDRLRTFLPPGRTGAAIYAVTVKAQPDLVKIGMTRKWQNRRKEYANWNLAPGDGITAARVFLITEEYVDLQGVEEAILASMRAPLYRGEWFTAGIEEAARHIDEFLIANDITYLLHREGDE